MPVHPAETAESCSRDLADERPMTSQQKADGAVRIMTTFVWLGLLEKLFS